MMNAASSSPPPVASPMAIPMFRALWLAATVSTVGSICQGVGVGWLMTELTPSPQLIAMTSSAGALAIVLVSLPAGALADLLDRRRLLLFVQSFMAVTAAILAVLTHAHRITPFGLLLGLFCMGIASTLNHPAWAALAPDLVPRPLLGRAMVWNSMSANVARIGGPVLGGILVAALGPAAALGLNAVSFLGAIAVLWRWRPLVPRRAGPPEQLGASMIAGLRFFRHNPELRAVTFRAAACYFFTVNGMALSPVVARVQLGGGASTLGILVGCIGCGAVLGAALRSTLFRVLGPPRLLPLAAALMSVALFVFPHTHHLTTAGIALSLFGAGYLLMQSSIDTSGQLVLPAWVRARGLAIHQMIANVLVALGAALGGRLAAAHGLQAAFTFTSMGLLGLAVVGVIRPLPSEETAPDLSSRTWVDAPAHGGELRGAIRVLVRYPLSPGADRAAALRAVQALRLFRLQEGASRWRLHEESGDPQVLVESFEVSSWDEYLRLCSRGTVRGELACRSAARACGGPPRTTCLAKDSLPRID